MDLCTNANVLVIFKIIKQAISILTIVISLSLIVLIAIDFFKALKGDEQSLSNAASSALRRFIAAVIVFFVPAIINGILTSIGTNSSGVLACFSNSTVEAIEDNLYNKAVELIQIAANTLNNANYRTAERAIEKLSDDDPRKEELRKSLESYYDALRQYNENNNAQFKYNTTNFNELQKEAYEKLKNNLEKIESASTEFWWPVGSYTTTVEGGKTYAKGTPASVNVTAWFAGNDDVHSSLGGHGAIDISGDPSIPAIAAKGGKVTKVVDGYDDVFLQPDANGNYDCSIVGSQANLIEITHPDGTKTVYKHLSKYTKKVMAGDTVSQGQVLAYIGSSGCSTGYHLHFEVWANGVKVDPLDYVSASNPRP